MKKAIIMFFLAAAITANAQNGKSATPTKKIGEYNFTEMPITPTHPVQGFYNQVKLKNLKVKDSAHAFGWKKISWISKGIAIGGGTGDHGETTINFSGITGKKLGSHVANTTVLSIGGSLVSSHLSGIEDYDLTDVGGPISGSYASRTFQGKNIGITLANQFDLGDLQICKGFSLSAFAGIFGRVSVEYGNETFTKISYDEILPPGTNSQTNYSLFVLSAGEQFGIKLKLKKWTMSISKELTSIYWRDCHTPLGPTKFGFADLGPCDTRHPWSTCLSFTYKLQ